MSSLIFDVSYRYNTDMLVQTRMFSSWHPYSTLASCPTFYGGWVEVGREQLHLGRGCYWSSYPEGITGLRSSVARYAAFLTASWRFVMYFLCHSAAMISQQALCCGGARSLTDAKKSSRRSLASLLAPPWQWVGKVLPEFQGFPLKEIVPHMFCRCPGIALLALSNCLIVRAL